MAALKRLLVDGDELLYRTLSGLEEETDWGDGIWTLHVNMDAARKAIADRLSELHDVHSPKELVLAFTGPLNFRKQLLPSYKSNRAGQRKPLCFTEIKLRMLDARTSAFVALQFDGLEADDVLGILATHPEYRASHLIISRDKDFLGVPCVLGDPPLEITEAEADLFHLKQVLSGDSSDGYSGCPKFGTVTAEKLLAPLPKEKRWGAVVAAYRKQGLTEADALVQARVARILRWGEYDWKTEEPKLWTPL